MCAAWDIRAEIQTEAEESTATDGNRHENYDKDITEDQNKVTFPGNLQLAAH